MLNLILYIIDAYIAVIFVGALLSWLQPVPGEFLYNVKSICDKLSSIVLNPIRRVLPVFRVGSAGLDLSPLIAIILLEVIAQLIARL